MTEPNLNTNGAPLCHGCGYPAALIKGWCHGCAVEALTRIQEALGADVARSGPGSHSEPSEGPDREGGGRGLTKGGTDDPQASDEEWWPELPWSGWESCGAM